MDAEPHDRSTLPYRDPVGLADLAGFGPAAVPAGVPGKRTLAVEGGRLVIEREILATQLQGIKVKTDDATSARG